MCQVVLDVDFDKKGEAIIGEKRRPTAKKIKVLILDNQKSSIRK